MLHVLSKADGEKFVANVHLLLKPGGNFYGWTVGQSQAGEWFSTPDDTDRRFLHSKVTVNELPR